ncbi:MAG TPA: O-antigen ligase family protein, partial [Burkholderiales bacterium]|nr:O-antigen ligase family protein [Burkholderiales bacterium]
AALGFWSWMSNEEIRSLQLNSVGHVNHTAIYLAIMLGLCVAWGLEGGRAPAIVATVCLLFALFLTTSRAALLVAFAMLVVLAAVHWRRSRAARAFTVALVVAASAVAAIGLGEVLRKNEQFMEKHDLLAQRPGVWRVGVEAWLRYPVAGIGVDNYKLINPELLKTWRGERGLPFDGSQYSHSAIGAHNFGHAHSLYIATLAERGIIGAISLAALLAAWLLALVRWRPRPHSDAQEWLLWGGAASAFMITAGVGLANTTLHHEHGILAALLLGLWLSKRPGR